MIEEFKIKESPYADMTYADVQAEWEKNDKARKLAKIKETYVHKNTFATVVILGGITILLLVGVIAYQHKMMGWKDDSYDQLHKMLINQVIEREHGYTDLNWEIPTDER